MYIKFTLGTYNVNLKYMLERGSLKPVRLGISAEVGQLARCLDGACAGAFHYYYIMIKVLM